MVNFFGQNLSFDNFEAFCSNFLLIFDLLDPFFIVLLTLHFEEILIRLSPFIHRVLHPPTKDLVKYPPPQECNAHNRYTVIKTQPRRQYHLMFTCKIIQRYWNMASTTFKRRCIIYKLIMKIKVRSWKMMSHFAHSVTMISGWNNRTNNMARGVF